MHQLSRAQSSASTHASGDSDDEIVGVVIDTPTAVSPHSSLSAGVFPRPGTGCPAPMLQRQRQGETDGVRHDDRGTDSSRLRIPRWRAYHALHETRDRRKNPQATPFSGLEPDCVLDALGLRRPAGRRPADPAEFVREPGLSGVPGRRAGRRHEVLSTRSLERRADRWKSTSSSSNSPRRAACRAGLAVSDLRRGTGSDSLNLLTPTLARFDTPHGPYRFSVTQRLSGRAPEFGDMSVLTWIGRSHRPYAQRRRAGNVRVPQHIGRGDHGPGQPRLAAGTADHSARCTLVLAARPPTPHSTA